MLRTIHRQMMVRIIVTVIAALAVISFFSHQAVQSIIQRNMTENYLNQVKLAANEVDSALLHHKKSVETFSRFIRELYRLSDDVQADVRSATRLFAGSPNKFVNGYWFTAHSNYRSQGKHSIWYGYDKNGRPVEIKSGQHIDASSPVYASDPRFDYYHGAVKSGGTHITAPFIDPLTHQPMLSISTPVYDGEDQLLGVAGIDVHYNDLQQVGLRLSFHPDSKTLLITRDGDLLYDPDKRHTIFANLYRDFDEDLIPIFEQVKKDITQTAETTSMTTYQDTNMIVFTVGLKEAEWIAMIMLPAAVIDSVLYRVAWVTFGTFTLVAVVVALLLHMWIRRLIHRPLRRLVDASSRLARGDYNVRVELDQHNEFRLLGEHMNRMTDSLHKQVQLEQEMKRMGALKVVGEMAAAISHEIRNPLTTVKGFLQLLRSKPEHAKEHVYFETMMEEIERANSIITEYLTLAQHKVAEFRKQSLNEVITHIYPLVQAAATTDCQEIRLELNPVPEFEMDEKEIRQLLHNLIRNGLEAMEANQTLTVRTWNDERAVHLEVEDEGPGFDSAVLQSAGTPFLTTKAGGTGLGLSICYRIVHRHRGSMEISSVPGKTLIHIRFPLIPEKPEPVQ
ncbi:MAG: ATP-binding protein [Paenibacillus dendritiformis]|uniref:HAMP domain-containing sensor histidine kinase n=1 Tax=uncultured Paenibacillus sp. TaxID=227322 RepID=UPI0025E18F2A|nr:ATP-binding protein [uncultured Paenibacillus sp.]MDU5140750.1 ATP-binding protein [Paenibacillus dendritiformis]